MQTASLVLCHSRLLFFQHSPRFTRFECKVNAAPKRHLHASPRELFAAEAPQLHPLPTWIPEVYALHQRLVDVEGFVTLHTNRYSAPFRLITVPSPC